MPDILHRLHIGAPAARVYDAITTADGIRSWWTRDADLESTVGGIGEFRFSYGTAVVTRVVVDELDRPRRVGWRVLASFRPEWADTTIAFDLHAEDSGTTVAFAHRNFAEADDRYAMTNTGWAYYLVSLQQYLESGRGAPSPDIDFARVIR